MAPNHYHYLNQGWPIIIHLRATSVQQESLMNLIHNICSEIILLNYYQISQGLLTLCYWVPHSQINGLMQKRHNSIANPLELHLSCIKPSKCSQWFPVTHTGFTYSNYKDLTWYTFPANGNGECDSWGMQCLPIMGGDRSCLWDIRCRYGRQGHDTINNGAHLMVHFENVTT